MPKLSWKLLTKKRGSSTQCLPPGKDNSSAGHIEEPRRYIRDFTAADANTATAMDLYEQMLPPNRVNPGSLSVAAKAVKPSPTSC